MFCQTNLLEITIKDKLLTFLLFIIVSTAFSQNSLNELESICNNDKVGPKQIQAMVKTVHNYFSDSIKTGYFYDSRVKERVTNRNDGSIITEMWDTLGNRVSTADYDGERIDKYLSNGFLESSLKLGKTKDTLLFFQYLLDGNVLIKRTKGLKPFRYQSESKILVKNKKLKKFIHHGTSQRMGDNETSYYVKFDSSQRVTEINYKWHNINENHRYDHPRESFDTIIKKISYNHLGFQIRDEKGIVTNIYNKKNKWERAIEGGKDSFNLRWMQTFKNDSIKRELLSNHLKSFFYSPEMLKLGSNGDTILYVTKKYDKYGNMTSYKSVSSELLEAPMYSQKEDVQTKNRHFVNCNYKKGILVNYYRWSELDTDTIDTEVVFEFFEHNKNGQLTKHYNVNTFKSNINSILKNPEPDSTSIIHHYTYNKKGILIKYFDSYLTEAIKGRTIEFKGDNKIITYFNESVSSSYNGRHCKANIKRENLFSLENISKLEIRNIKTNALIQEKFYNCKSGMLVKTITCDPIEDRCVTTFENPTEWWAMFFVQKGKQVVEELKQGKTLKEKGFCEYTLIRDLKDEAGVKEKLIIQFESKDSIKTINLIKSMDSLAKKEDIEELIGLKTKRFSYKKISNSNLDSIPCGWKNSLVEKLCDDSMSIVKDLSKSYEKIETKRLTYPNGMLKYKIETKTFPKIENQKLIKYSFWDENGNKIFEYIYTKSWKSPEGGIYGNYWKFDLKGNVVTHMKLPLTPFKEQDLNIYDFEKAFKQQLEVYEQIDYTYY